MKDMEVVAVDTLPYRIKKDRVLELAASAEQRLTHPVASTVVNYVQQVVVGSDRWLEKCGIALDCLYHENSCNPDNCEHKLGCRISAHDSLLYIAVDGEFQGVIHYTDPLRVESASVIHQLQTEYGMEIHLLTGDNQSIPS